MIEMALDKGRPTHELLGVVTRPQLALYSYLKEKEKFANAVQKFAKGGALQSQVKEGR